MTKQSRRSAATSAPPVSNSMAIPDKPAVVFSMPEPVDSTEWMTHYTEVFYDPWGEFYQPPIDRKGLAKLTRANAYHGAILMARRNMVAGRFTSEGVPRTTITAFVHNYLQSGDAALLKLRNYWGQMVGLYALSRVYLRRGRNGFVLLQPNGNHRQIPEEDVIWLAQYDPEQQIYGLPDYLGACSRRCSTGTPRCFGGATS